MSSADLRASTLGSDPDSSEALDRSRSRWRMLALVALAELLGMACWFTATAVAPELAAGWQLSAGQAAWLTSIVQLGFVAGTLIAAVLNLADVLPSRAYFAGAAVGAAGANALLLIADGLPGALAGRFLTGLCLAGVYPPAMKMAATWFRSQRGLAIGIVVGALTVGKAAPYLVDALGGVRVTPVVMTTSAAALVAALLVGLGYRDGPFAFPRRPFAWRLVGDVARDRRVRLITGGYVGHMLELYAYWAWIAAFLHASIAASAAAGRVGPGDGVVTALAFAAIAVGAFGCVAGGYLADRIGRERLVMGALILSGGCALAIGTTFGGPIWPVALVTVVWGIAVIADSAQFSVLVTEVAPPHAVGTALTLQTSLGFLATVLTIQAVPVVAATVGWRWAFSILALGPALGIPAIARLWRLRSEAAGSWPGWGSRNTRR